MPISLSPDKSKNKQGAAHVASIKVPFKKDPIETLIPNQDLPVDTERLRKAIKNALIKNDNNPDKIDIQSIMREQVRIHKHI